MDSQQNSVNKLKSFSHHFKNSDHSAIRITSSSIPRLQAYPNIEDKMQNHMNSAPKVKLSLCNHGQMLEAVHEFAKRWTRLSDFTLTFHFHALEKEMATHSSILAWRIPGTGELGGLPSMGSHRVGHNWSDLAAAAAAAAAELLNPKKVRKWSFFSVKVSSSPSAILGLTESYGPSRWLLP